MINKLSNVTNQTPDLKIDQVESVHNKVDFVKHPGQPAPELTKEKVEKVVNSVNEFLKGTNTQLVYKYHDGLQEYYAAVVNEYTNEVVSEIPPRKLLNIYAAMKEYTGLLLDKKA